MTDPRAHFQTGAAGYAAFRPTYPAELASALAALAPDRALAVDVGCGSGQLTQALAGHFDAVVGVDASAAQLAEAAPDTRIEYVVGSSDALPVPDGSAALVAAAQAAHWFDLPRFYDEVRRVARPGGVVALVSYGPIEVSGPLAERFRRFYRDELHRFWPPERAHVESGYRELPFPFPDLPMPQLSIDVAWSPGRLLGYVRSWSAAKAALAAGQGAVIEAFEADARALPPDSVIAARFPLALRVGRVG